MKKSFTLGLVYVFLLFIPVKYANAHGGYCCQECSLDPPCIAMSLAESTLTTSAITAHTNDEFQAHRVWWISVFWEDNILPALMLMAEQLTTVAVKQSEIIGGFMDAKQQMETQQVLQKITARAHKDYHPSTGMCEFGSSIKSLAASERQSEVNAVILAQRSVDKGLGNANTSAASGKLSDLEGRLKQYREVYCNTKDNNSALDYLCEHDQDENLGNSTVAAAVPGGIGGPDRARLNKDIDYARTLDFPWTLDVNFVDNANTPTAEEEDVFALAANLYGTTVFTRPDGDRLASDPNNPEQLTKLQDAYMDARSVLAKRSVAENSYNALVGMKSSGSVGSRDFLEALLLELGIDDVLTNVQLHQGDSAGTPPNYPTANVTALDAMLGENPSYWAQMEVLTKKIYQNPDFYTNLYDKPANVERKGVAMQAIGLMQKFDLLKSNLRNESSQSILLELAVMELQGEIEEEIQKATAGGQ